jgi:hypothetical protein
MTYHVAGCFEENVGDEKNHQSCAVLIAGQFEIIRHASNLGIADVGTIL